MLLSLLTLLCAPPRTEAASGPEIDGSAHATLNLFFREIWSSRELANKAVAILVFLNVIKAGFGVGAEYGEGALLIRGRTAAYFNIVSASFGFQLGAQARSAIPMFMTEEALASFARPTAGKLASTVRSQS